MNLRNKMIRVVMGDDLYNLAVKLRSGGQARSLRRYAFDPITIAVLAVGAAAIGSSSYQGAKSRTASKKTADAAESANSAAIKRQDDAAAKLESDQASAAAQASSNMAQRKRRVIAGSKSVYSSPLGLSGSANLARKKLLGE